MIICILHRYLHVYLDAHWFREYLYLRSCHPLLSSHQRQSRWRRQSSSEEIVSRNYAASGKGPLCSGASQFAAGYAAAQISIDKRLSCTASDDALSIFRAHYKMQIDLLFTLTLKPAIKKGAGLYVTRLVVSSGVVIVNDFADRGVVNAQHFLRQIVVGQ